MNIHVLWHRVAQPTSNITHECRVPGIHCSIPVLYGSLSNTMILNQGARRYEAVSTTGSSLSLPSHCPIPLQGGIVLYKLVFKMGCCSSLKNCGGVPQAKLGVSRVQNVESYWPNAYRPILPVPSMPHTTFYNGHPPQALHPLLSPRHCLTPPLLVLPIILSLFLISLCSSCPHYPWLSLSFPIPNFYFFYHSFCISPLFPFHFLSLSASNFSSPSGSYLSSEVISTFLVLNPLLFFSQPFFTPLHSSQTASSFSSLLPGYHQKITNINSCI